jgi:hypothetical protein
MVNFGDAAAYRRVCVRDVQCREVFWPVNIPPDTKRWPVNILNTERHAHTPYDILPHHQNWPFTVLISDFNKEQYELPEDDLKNGSKHVGAF